ncbi:MAG: DUF5050 domain-containing protein [Desulfitobacteriaceae bacterium]|nr:DUF5050 domain-containing protein [Desulfitobacteriaceae bacterium]
MKTTLKTGVLAIMILLLMSGTVMAKGNDIKVKINFFMEWGEIHQNSVEFENKEKPRLEKGRVLIPLRKISDNLGFVVAYNEETKQIDLADSNGKRISLTLSSKNALVNNKAVELDMPAKVINQVTFVPLRFISENFDQAVQWDPATRTAIIDNFTISTPEYLFNLKTLELSKRDESGQGKHTVLGKIPMSVDWVSMRVIKTNNGNDVIVIDNNTGAPHLYHYTYTVYVSENEIIDQSEVDALFPGKAVISPDGEKIVIGDGKTAKVYDDKTKKLQYEYDLHSLFETEKDPNPISHWETAYVVLGFGENYILVKDTFKMLTKMVYLDTKEIINIYELLLSKEEQEEALQDAGPFGSGDRLTFVEEKDGKLIFNKSYYESPYVKTKKFEYNLESTTESLRGNTTGNLNNNGLYAKEGDWIYYSNLADQGKLYKMKADGTEATKITDDTAWYINVVGDEVFYSGDGWKLIKIKTDGSDKTVLDTQAYHINVVGGWVFYTRGTMQDGTIYKMKTDGSNRTQISKDPVSQLVVMDDAIYYSSYYSKLIKINPDGSGKTKLISSGSVTELNVVDDWIYFNYNKLLYKMKTDGTQMSEISSDDAREINVSEGRIFYSDHSEYWKKLYKINVDGSGKEKLSDDKPGDIHVLDNKLYYINLYDNTMKEKPW